MQDTLSGLFETQAARSPDAVAVSCKDRHLTYRQLDELAGRLACYLRQSGVGPDVAVGLCLDRSLEMVTGILGTLKAGGTYVPIDPNYPPERMQYMLEDSGAKILLSMKDIQKRLPRLTVATICLDSDWNEIAAGADNPKPAAVSQNAAYVIYTSGSTGRPKGVVVSHGNAVRLFAVTAKWFNFTADDIWTWFHSYTFDFSVWELWGALLHGGRLVIVPYWMSRMPEAFYELVREAKVTVMNQTPSAFRLFSRAALAHPDSAAELSLRLVIFGGEALDLKSLRPWFGRHGDRSPKLVNMYGITEITVHATYQDLTTEMTRSGASLIGEQLGDLEIHVLDENFQPVSAGELYVGGAGVARGYLNRPDLTAERFLPDPFSEIPGQRLYRSGDLGRRGPNGSLEFSGRIDHQVKIRGHRIELGEIEAELSALPLVRHAMVLAHDDGNGERRLIAYVVPSGPAEPLALRRSLSVRLPDYMVPSTFILLDSFPLTANGKIDTSVLLQKQTN